MGFVQPIISNALYWLVGLGSVLLILIIVLVILGTILRIIEKITGKKNLRPKEEKFNLRERKKIRDSVKKQLETKDAFIALTYKKKHILFPKPGRIFRIKRNTRRQYSLTPADSLVFVQSLSPEKRNFFDPLDYPPKVGVVSLNQDGQFNQPGLLPIIIEDLEPIPKEEEEKVFSSWQTMPLDQDVLQDGQAVEMIKDQNLIIETDSGFISVELKKGLKGVVDNPGVRSGVNLSSLNRENPEKYFLEFRLFLSTENESPDLLNRENKTHKIPSARQGEKYEVYFPKFRQIIPADRSIIKPRDFDKTLFDKVVMAEKTRELILSIALSDEKKLAAWGLNSFLKGKGKIFFAFGPPGTGKTLTGEALAEFLGRPLYVIDGGELFSSRNFEDKLKEIIERTERWQSLTIIDEAEMLLLRRDWGQNLISQAMLRQLETLEKGIIWFTSNRPGDIDSAFKSRIAANIFYPPLDREARKIIWRFSIPQEMPISGLNDEKINALAKLELNGREIKNAVLNAGRRASQEGREDVPTDYLLEAGQTILEQTKVLEDVQKKSPEKMRMQEQKRPFQL